MMLSCDCRGSAFTFALLVAIVGPLMTPAWADEGLFDQVDIGPVSIGGRATYYDPKDAGGKWYGGGQVRVYPWRYFAIEGSADYRRNDFGDTRVHSYPVQVSALIYPLGTTRLAPFILGGGWYYTTSRDRAGSTIRKIDSGSMPAAACSSSSTGIGRSTVRTATSGSKRLPLKIKIS